MAEIIRVDGSREKLKNTSLESLQKAVGGWIEVVQSIDGDFIVLDEEGKLKCKPLNKTATKLYGNKNDFIVGDVVICTEKELN